MFKLNRNAALPLSSEQLLQTENLYEICIQVLDSKSTRGLDLLENHYSM